MIGWRKKPAKYSITFGEKTSAKKEKKSAKYGVKFRQKKLLLKLKEKTSAKYGIKSGWWWLLTKAMSSF